MVRKFFHSYRALALVLVLLLGYAWQIEPRLLTVRRLVIRDPVLARAWPGLTIVHLTDPHIAREGGREARLLSRIREIKPDLILLSGDYRQWGSSPGPAQHFLAQLAAPLGVYGVLGDSDQDQGPAGCGYCHPDGQYHTRRATPVLLRNELRSLPWRGGRIAVVGIEPYGGLPWLPTLQEATATATRRGAPLLVLSHQSRPWQSAPLPAHSLWLAGDTHGGQIRLPGWVWTRIPYKPDPAHMAGLYDNGRGGWLLVNRGIGQTAWFPFRLGVVPEICVITFAEN